MIIKIPVGQSRSRHSIECRMMAIQAARTGDFDQLKALVDGGINVNLCDRRGNTLLMLASFNGHVSCAQLLLDHGAAVSCSNHRGRTPLGAAAYQGHDELVERLLKCGASVDEDNGKGMTPFGFAALFGRDSTMRLLEAHGADRSRVKNLKCCTKKIKQTTEALGKLF